MQRKRPLKKRSSIQQIELYDKITKLETEALRMIHKCKASPAINICQHLILQSLEPEVYDPSANYYDRFWKKYLCNEIKREMTSRMLSHNRYIQKRILKIQDRFKQRQDVLQSSDLATSKYQQIQKPSNHTCLICNHHYPDEQTLMLHQKIKHANLAQERIINQDRASSSS